MKDFNKKVKIIIKKIEYRDFTVLTNVNSSFIISMKDKNI